MFGKIPLDNGTSQAFHTVWAELSLAQISPNLLDLRRIPCFSIFREGIADGISVATGKDSSPQNVKIFPWLSTERHSRFSDVIFKAFRFHFLVPLKSLGFQVNGFLSLELFLIMFSETELVGNWNPIFFGIGSTLTKNFFQLFS